MRRLRGDDGAYAILYALLMLVVLGLASIVVDLGLLRADKRDSRSAADAAALAGARDLGFGPYAPLTACQTAFEYVLDNLQMADTLSPCSSVVPGPGFLASVATCSGVTQVARKTVDGVTIVISWPVPAASALLLDPDGEPESGTPRVYQEAFDGTALGCDRLGVQILRERSLGVSAALGVSKGGSFAGSVARTLFQPGDAALPYPLVVLDPRSCNSLAVDGGTKIVVTNKGDTPGRIGIDSDGTESGNGQDVDKCGGTKVITDVAGSGSRITAMAGASGAPAAVEVFGPSTLTTNAFDAGDTSCGVNQPCLSPVPTVRSSRITRTPFDTQFNCGVLCPGGSAQSAYVDRFASASFAVTAANAAAQGWTVITGNPACQSPPPAGGSKYFVSCGGTYLVDGQWSFPAGVTVIVDGNLEIKGCLVVNAGVAACTTPPPNGPTFLPTNALLSVRGEVFGNGSAGRLVLPQVLLHQPLSTSRLDLNGFDTVFWTAPYVEESVFSTKCNPSMQSVADIPPADCFRNLALWTEHPAPQNAPARIGAGSNLTLAGTFFLGRSKLRVTGGANSDIEDAQFVAKRIEATGGSTLTFVPNPDRTTSVPSLGVALVR